MSHTLPKERGIKMIVVHSWRDKEDCMWIICRTSSQTWLFKEVTKGCPMTSSKVDLSTIKQRYREMVEDISNFTIGETVNALGNEIRDFEASLRAMLKEQEDFFIGRNTNYKLAVEVLKEILGLPSEKGESS
jgi:hypothetical protein